MVENIVKIAQIKNTRKYNQIIFNLQKLPLIGKIFNDTLYREGYSQTFSILILIYNTLMQLLRKALYFGLILLASFIMSSSHSSLTLADSFLYFLAAFTLIAGSLVNILRFEMGDKDVTLFVMMFRLDPREYYISETISNSTVFIFFFGVVLSVFMYFIPGLTVLNAFIFTITALALRLFSQLLYVFLYSHKTRFKGLIHNILMIVGIFLVSAITPIAFTEIIFYFDMSFAAEAISVVPSVILLLLSLTYLFSTKKYEAIARTSLSHTPIELDSQKLVAQAARDSVKIKVQDIIQNTDRNKYENYSGISYVNMIFFDRLGKAFRKTLRGRFIVSIVLLVASVVLVGIVRFEFFDLNVGMIQDFTIEGNPGSGIDAIFGMVGLIIVILVSINLYSGVTFTYFSFFHMDRYLMKLNFYREPKNLLESIRIRFVKLLEFNLPMFINFLAALVIVYFGLGGGDLSTIGFVALFSLICMLFFSMHYLYMYYLFQPYTEEMEQKSYIYSAVNSIINFIPFIIMTNIESIDESAIFAFLVFMFVYLIVGYIAVRIFAPRTFKLRK